MYDDVVVSAQSEAALVAALVNAGALVVGEGLVKPADGFLYSPIGAGQDGSFSALVGIDTTSVADAQEIKAALSGGVDYSLPPVRVRAGSSVVPARPPGYPGNRYARGAYITPEMYGAVPDYDLIANRGTDSGAALQAAFDDAVRYGVRCFLGSNRYLSTRPLSIGNNVDGFSGGWSIVGNGSSGDAGGCSITIVGAHESALSVLRSAWRGGYVGGFSVRCKPTLGTHVYWSPESESAFPVENGLCFPGSYFSALRFEDLVFVNAKRTIALLGRDSENNGEFNVYRRVSGDRCARFFYQAPNTGQSFGHKFENCGAGPEFQHIGDSGFVAFELGGGGGGFGIEVSGFDSTVVHHPANMTGITSVEQLPRSTLLRDNGYDGHVRITGGRNEGYTTLFHNADGRQGSHTVIECVDMAGMMSGTKNPTVIGGKADIKGSLAVRDSTIPVMARSEAFASGAFLNFPIGRFDWTNYLFERCAFNVRNDANGVESRMEVTTPNTPTGQIEFRDCLYRRTNAQNDLRKLNARYRGANYAEIAAPIVSPA